jgi:hypothetical protein
MGSVGPYIDTDLSLAKAAAAVVEIISSVGGIPLYGHVALQYSQVMVTLVLC